MSTTQQYLQTLRRIPDDIILSMATRDVILQSGSQCLCGWALREDLARAVGKDADDVFTPLLVRTECRDRFGGDWDDWNAIFTGVVNFMEAPKIEDAFVTRVMEAAGVAA